MTSRHSAPAAGFVGVLLAAGLIACGGSDSRLPTSPSGSPPGPSTPPRSATPCAAECSMETITGCRRQARRLGPTHPSLS